MIKNVFIKKLLKNTVFKGLSLINRVVPKKSSSILLYTANGGIQHALIPLRRYLIEEGYTRNNTIFCGVSNSDYFENDDCVYINQIHAILKFFTTKYVFYTAGQIPIKPSKEQIVIYLGHGCTNFKTYGKLTNINNGDEFFFTHRTLTSSLFLEADMQALGCTRECELILGDAMLDMFGYPGKNIDELGLTGKVLFWLPTFRQSSYLGYSDSKYSNLIPLFDENDYEKLNDYLKSKNITIIVKLHNMQNYNNENINYSNLLLWRDSDLQERGLQLYPLLSKVDGLIGDYSSVSMQFLITNKPQAYVVPDIEDYKAKRGFLFDNPEDYMGGWIIKDKIDFYRFLDDFSKGTDPYKEKREHIRNQVFDYPDFRNTERIVKFTGIKK